jgi:glycosyltransferase involved in cell wall biosynthesis
MRQALGRVDEQGHRAPNLSWDRPEQVGLVSVVVPVFNGADFLGEALESLIAQSHRCWEAIVVDDGSIDRSLDVAAALAQRDARIRTIQQSNFGASAARNRGVLECGGEFIQFLDADDRLCPDKLSEQVRYLRAHPEVDIVTGDARYFDAAGWRDDIGPLPPAEDLVADLLLRNHLSIDSPLSRRSMLARVGGFRSHTPCGERVYGCEDWDLWLRAALSGCQMAYVPGVVAHNRWHSKNTQRDRVKMLRSALWALSQNVGALSPKHEPWWWLSVIEKRMALGLARHVPRAYTAAALVRIWRRVGRLLRSHSLPPVD